jgi:hypothetical protein
VQYWQEPHEKTGRTAIFVPARHSPCVGPHRDDFATQFVAHDHAGGRILLRLDIRPADPARGDADNQLVDTRCRIWHLDDIETVVLRGDCCLHATSSSSMSNTDRYSSNSGSKSARVTPDPSRE